MRKSRKQEIISRLKEGEKVSEIAREVGVTKSYVSQVKKELEREVFNNEGEIEAAVFKLFENGKSPVDVVIELKMPAVKVEELYEKYLDLKELPSITELELREELDRKMDECMGQVRKGISKAFSALQKRLMDEIKSVSTSTEDSIKKLSQERNIIIGVLRKMSEILTFLVIKDISLSLLGTVDHPPNSRDAELKHEILNAKESLQLLLAIHGGSYKGSIVEYLNLQRNILKGVNDEYGVKVMDELLSILA